MSVNLVAAAALVVGGALAVMAWRRRVRGAAAPSVWLWVERASWLATIIAVGFALNETVLSRCAPTATPGPSAQAVVTVPGSAVTTAAPQGTSPPVRLTKDEFLLTPSSDIDTNDLDKVDLDSGYPGHGDAPLLIGPPRNGGLADIIMEEGEIHPARTNDLAYLLLPAGQVGSYERCRAGLTDTKSKLSRIPLGKLKQGVQFCVMTNERHTALVRVVRAPSGVPLQMVVGFTVWE